VECTIGTAADTGTMLYCWHDAGKMLCIQQQYNAAAIQYSSITIQQHYNTAALQYSSNTMQS
jgi:hypothetical protein